MSLLQTDAAEHCSLWHDDRGVELAMGDFFFDFFLATLIFFVGRV